MKRTLWFILSVSMLATLFCVRCPAAGECPPCKPLPYANDPAGPPRLVATNVGGEIVNPVARARPRRRGRKPVSKEEISRRVKFQNSQKIPNRKWIRKLIPDSYDARTQNQTPAVDDQGQCGDCYWHSACGVVAVGQIVAGIAQQPFGISVQWGIDNHPEQGGCSGGDEWSVTQLYMEGGGPSTAQYIGPGQTPGTPQDTSKMTMYKIAGMGYADPASAGFSPANSQDVQTAILKYGPVSIAVAAGDDWDNYQAGQILTSPNGQCNHAILAIGWKTVNGKIVWLDQNSWGTGWGDNGTCWVQDGTASVNTEAFFVWCDSPPPTPTPTPAPTPTPTPTVVTTLTLPMTLPAGTYELHQAGTQAAIDNATAAVEALKALKNKRK